MNCSNRLLVDMGVETDHDVGETNPGAGETEPSVRETKPVLEEVVLLE